MSEVLEGYITVKNSEEPCILLQIQPTTQTDKSDEIVRYMARYMKTMCVQRSLLLSRANLECTYQKATGGPSYVLIYFLM